MSFADSFESFKDFAADAAIGAMDGTKRFAEVSKAKIAIRSLNSKIKKAQLELGKLYYQDHSAGTPRDAPEYLLWCKRIDEAQRTIADLRDYIENLKSERADVSVSEDEGLDDLEEIVEDTEV